MEIGNAFKDINKKILNEDEMILNIVEIFSQVENQLENIASISVEHASSTEEITAALQWY